MASIYKRTNENGTTVWRAVIRIKGYPSISNHFERKQEADDWAKETERRIKLGQFNFTAHNKHHTYSDLLHRMKTDGAFTHQRSFKHWKAQYDYWQERLGTYGLTHINPEIIAQERKLLLESSRSPATINRYTAVLGSTLTYAVKKLRWLTDAVGELAKKAQVITTAELRKILFPFMEWPVSFGSTYNHQPSMMQFPFIRTIDAYDCAGFLVRCAPVKQYDLAHARIASVFQRYSNVFSAWAAEGRIDNTKDGQFIGTKESQRFAALASGKEVTDHNGIAWKMI